MSTPKTTIKKPTRTPPSKYTKIISKAWVPYVLVFFLTVLSYSTSFKHDYNLDDQYIYQSLPKPEEGLHGVFSVFYKSYNFSDYRPVTILTFAIEQLIFGLNPEVSHAINIFLFLLLCCSIYYIFVQLPVNNIKFTILAATLLFCVHTSHTEVVCSIKNRDNILSMLFGIWSLHAFIQFHLLNKKRYLISGILLMLTAVLCKLDAAVFLLLTPLSFYTFYTINYKKIILIIITIFVVLLVQKGMMDHVISQEKSSSFAFASFTENPLSTDASFLNKISQGIQSASYYVKFMLIPKDYYYYFGYDMIPVKSLFSPLILFLFILHTFFLLYGVYQLKRNKLLGYSILFFYFSISYCLNIIAIVAGIVSVRYSFIASFGFCLLSGVTIQLISDKLKTSSFIQQSSFTEKIRQHSTSILTIIGVLYFLPFTISRNSDWKNIYTLIKADIGDLKQSFQGNRIAASYVLHSSINEDDSLNQQLLLKQGLLYALNARSLYKKDNYINELTGQAYYRLNNFPSAKTVFKENLLVNDTSVTSLEFLGDIYFEKESKYDSAAILFKKIISIRPTYDTPYFKYLNAAYKAGKKKDVLEYFSTMSVKKQNGYIPVQCLAYYYLFENDSAKGMLLFKQSFDLGFRNSGAAKFAKDYFVRHQQPKEAREMNRYSPGAP